MNRRKFLRGLFALPVATAITINTKLAIFEYTEPKTLASIGLSISKLDTLTNQLLTHHMSNWMNSGSISERWLK